MNRLLRSLFLAAALLAPVAAAFAASPGPVPALPDAERRTSYSITGTTCACAVNFALYGDSSDYGNWVEVWLNGTLIPSANYTITSPSGSLSTLPRPITDAVMTFNFVQTGTVQIVGARRPRRTSQFAENRGVAARDLNQAVTDIVAMLRENWDKTNDVTGRAVLAPPGETLAVLASAASRASSGACFDASGNLVSCVSIPSTTFTAGNGIAITGTSPKTITSNIQGSGPITITGTNPLIVGCATCNTSPAAATSAVFVASRAAAVSLDLHTFSVVRTGGYAAGGDGGGATFKNVGSAAFLDSFISTGSLTTPGSAYTNGTYTGVPLTGGTGNNATATIIVAGNVVTTVTLTGSKGNAYTAGDVLSASNASIGGTGTGFAWTVSTVTSPSGSFTDSSGAHWQIVPEGSGINVKMFGAKFDWAGSDGGATNDWLAIQNALFYASYNLTTKTVDGGGAQGIQVFAPTGTALVCNGTTSLQVPFGVRFSGQNIWSTTLKVCDSGMDSATHFMTLCDPTTLAACFATRVENMTLYANSSPASGANVFMVFSNNLQQMNALSRVAIYSGLRGCLLYNQGYGGSALFGIEQVECTPWPTSTNPGISFTNVGTTLLKIRDSHVESGGSGATLNGVQISGGGILDIDGLHSEGISTAIFLNITGSTSNGAVRLHNLTGGAHCTNLVLKQGGSVASDVIVGMAFPNGCTNTVNNGGSLTATPVIADTVY